MINQKLGRVAVAPKGEWSAGTYTRLDVVTHGGQGFICSSAETSEEPGTGSAWQLIATKGRDFTYSDFTEEQIAGLMKPATDAATEIGKTNEEYKAMLTEQAKAFGDAQQARTESYTDAERARDRAYTKAETDRDAAYNEAEGKRQDSERVRGENEGSRKSAEQTRSTAENERAEAEGGRKQAEQTRDTAETKRDTAEKARVKAEGEREQGWTELKAEAEKSVSDAQAAIAEVKATEARLYPVVENVLRGTAKDTFVHVDDAFPSSLLSIEIEGACKQDGTPSPESPAPITVIENPVLMVTGRNLVNLHDRNVPANDKTEFYIFGLVPSGTTAYISFVSSDNVDATYDDAAATGLGNGNDVAYSVEPTSIKAGINKTTITPNFDATEHLPFYGYRIPTTSFHMSNYQLEVGGYHDYRPYTSTALPITLPAEHPYLAKLPDGTADTIEVDKDGNVTLVARVGIDRDVREIETFKQGQYYNLKTTIKAFASPGAHYYGGEMCSALPARDKSVDGNGIYRTWTSVYVRDTSGRTREEIQAEIDKNAPLTIAVKIPETVYQLGKVTVPSLPDSISNIWTDAELTPKTGIEYTRDVNIAFANIEDAIASITQG